MTSRMLTCRLLSLAALMLTSGIDFAQLLERPDTKKTLLAEDSSSVSSSRFSDSAISAGDSATVGAGFVTPVRASQEPRVFRPFSRIGVAWRLGIGGAGFDVATPLARKLNLRAGYDRFGYTFAFKEEGADVNAAMRMSAGHTALDWFPFGGWFRISPLMVFANSNQMRGTALIPAGNSLSMNGQDYVSSSSDPLHGSGSVTFRKVSPGLTLGFGNMIPRKKSHVSFPVEAGFYYVGQPTLKVILRAAHATPTTHQSWGVRQ